MDKVLQEQQEMEQIKQAAKEDYLERSEIYKQITDNPTLDSLAAHIVQLYDADAQSMRQQIIDAALFKTLLDVVIEKKLASSEEIDNRLATNVKTIEDAYTEQYEKLEAFLQEQENKDE